MNGAGNHHGGAEAHRGGAPVHHDGGRTHDRDNEVQQSRPAQDAQGGEGERMLSVDETIQHVELLYAQITGREPPAQGGAYAAIPPEKDPGGYLEQTMERLERLLASGGRLAMPEQPAWAPAVDVCEGEAEYVVLVDLPGVERASVQLAVLGNVLTIAGGRSANVPAGMLVRRAERMRGRFVRHVLLGPAVRAEEATARLSEGGVLEVRIPKGMPSPAPQRVIDIN